MLIGRKETFCLFYKFYPWYRFLLKQTSKNIRSCIGILYQLLQIPREAISVYNSSDRLSFRLPVWICNNCFQAHYLQKKLFFSSSPNTATLQLSFVELNSRTTKSKFLKIHHLGTSLMVQWLRLHAPNARDPGSFPGQGTRSHMLQLRPSTGNKYVFNKICHLFEGNYLAALFFFLSFL